MSFDLYFCRRNNEKITSDQLVEYFNKNPKFKIEEIKESKGYQFLYTNRNTGVYFIVEYSPFNRENGESVIPDGFYDVDLACFVNYFRPTFFVHEAMPVIEEIAKAFQLLVVDPQDDEIGGNNKPKECKAGELIEAWEKSNTRSVKNSKISDETKPLYLSKEKAMAWWNYLKNKEDIDKNMHEDIFIPSLFILHELATGKLFTGITWTQAIPQLFPKCDIVIMGQKKKKLFGLYSRIEFYVIAYDRLMSEIQEHLEPFESSVPDIKILKIEKAEKIKNWFDNVKAEKFDGYKSLASDGFIDVEI